MTLFAQVLSVGTAGDDLGTRMAWRPARPPGPSGIPAAAAPDRRTPAGRPVPVTLAPVSAADSGHPDSTDTRPRWRNAAGPRTLPQRPVRRRPGHRPAATTGRPDGIAGGRSSGRTADTSPCPAGGVPCGGHPGLDTRWLDVPPPPRTRRRRPAPRRSPAGCVWTVGCRRPPCSLPCSGGCGGVRGGPRPCGQQPAALAGAPWTLPRCPVPRTPAGFRARSAQPADTDGPEGGQRTRLVDAGSPQASGAADTRDCGRIVRTLRQRHARQSVAEPSTTAAMSDRNGTAGCGIGQHRHGSTARFLGWCSASTACRSVLFVLLRSEVESIRHQIFHLVTDGGLPPRLPQRWGSHRLDV